MLSKQAVRWSRDHITGSGLELGLARVICWPGTGFSIESRAQTRLLPWGGGGGGSTCIGNVSAEINPWLVIDFSSGILLTQSSRQFLKVYWKKYCFFQLWLVIVIRSYTFSVGSIYILDLFPHPSSQSFCIIFNRYKRTLADVFGNLLSFIFQIVNCT